MSQVIFGSGNGNSNDTPWPRCIRPSGRPGMETQPADDLVLIQRRELLRLLRCAEAWERCCARGAQHRWHGGMAGLLRRMHDLGWALWPWLLLAGGAGACIAAIVQMLRV